MDFQPGGYRSPERHHLTWSRGVDFPLARAVMASAAFPIGLPPLTLRKRDFPKGTRFRDLLAGTTKIHLTDGGVLENLGIQTLVKRGRYSAWNLIVSDAGTQQRPWRDTGAYGTFRGLLVWLLSGRILDRVMLLMNDKQNRWARQMVYSQLLLSRLVEETLQSGPDARARVESYVERHRRGHACTAHCCSCASHKIGVASSVPYPNGD